MPRLGDEFYIYNVHSEKYLFVSGDTINKDGDGIHVVEGKYAKTPRGKFKLREVPEHLLGNHDEFLLKNEYYGEYVYVSSGIRNGDNVVKASSGVCWASKFKLSSQAQTKLQVQNGRTDWVQDPVTKISCYDFQIFLSHDWINGDQVVEAKKSDEKRGIFRLEPCR